MPNYIPKICIALLLIAVLPLPIWFYSFLRFVVCGTFALGALIAYERSRQDVFIYYGLVALLFNPFFPIFHSKEIWVVFDLVAALLLYKTAKYVTSENITEPSEESNVKDN
jgi:hypothetical protein